MSIATPIRQLVLSLALVLTVWSMPCVAAAQARHQVVDDVDKFVLGYLDKIQLKSVAENRQYCGLVAFDPDGKLHVTQANGGTAAGCAPGTAPAGWEVIAAYKTHGAFLDNAETEIPSAAELNATIKADVDTYVATPGGRVWLNMAAEKMTYQLCGRRCVKADPKARSCKSFTPKIDYTLQQLREREKKPVNGC